MLNAMRPAFFSAAVPMLFCSMSAPTQTSGPPSPPTTPAGAAMAAPTAARSTYAVQNGELVVAPGLRVPNGNVPWVLDASGGKQTLVPVHHAALNAASATAGTLSGAASKTPVHSATPVFFIHNGDRTENTGDAGRGALTGWALIAARVEGASRVVERPKFNDVEAATVCNASSVCLVAESLLGGWLRLIPKNPLAPGEYALVPVPRSTAGNVAVAYDFTVDAQSATESKDAVAPGQNLDAAKKKKH